jgi:stress-induced morphogen
MSVKFTIYTDCIGAGLGTLNLSVPSTSELEERIATALPGAQVSVEDLTGGGDHFRAEIVSDRFEGLSRIEQHKLVYDVFGDDIGGAIHALSIKTSSLKRPAQPAAQRPDKPGATT